MQIKFFKMTEEDLDKVVEIENDNLLNFREEFYKKYGYTDEKE